LSKAIPQIMELLRVVGGGQDREAVLHGLYGKQLYPGCGV
jgi:hypothetical protein